MQSHPHNSTLHTEIIRKNDNDNNLLSAVEIFPPNWIKIAKDFDLNMYVL